MSTKKLQEFINSKSYIKDECMKVIKHAEKNNFQVMDLSMYVMEKYKGIDQFLIHWSLIYSHMQYEGKYSFMEKMDNIYDEVLNEWILNNKNIRDKELFILQANTRILSVPSKKDYEWVSDGETTVLKVSL